MESQCVLCSPLAEGRSSGCDVVLGCAPQLSFSDAIVFARSRLSRFPVGALVTVRGLFFVSNHQVIVVGGLSRVRKELVKQGYLKRVDNKWKVLKNG